ncbi:MAG: hypothetical protein HY000_07675 [Planctomycetes bacterium]|nr:hypothetical protein [Planctomycetota bacterium]
MPRPIVRIQPEAVQLMVTEAPEPCVCLPRLTETLIPCPRWTVTPAEILTLASLAESESRPSEFSFPVSLEQAEPEPAETAAGPASEVAAIEQPTLAVPAIAVDFPVRTQHEQSPQSEISDFKSEISDLKSEISDLRSGADDVPVRSHHRAVWDLPEGLWPWLDAVASDPQAAEWSSTVRHLIAELAYVQTKGSRDVQPILAELRRKASDVDQLVGLAPSPEAQTQLRRTQHALLRRLDVWELVAALEQQEPRELTRETPQPPERTAARVEIPGLLRERVIQPRELLSSIERYETSGLASDARRVVELERQLASSLLPAELALHKRIETHYRNCNLRIAVTDDLINRLVPQPEPTTGQVRERILNLPIRGHNSTSTQLSVRLAPDPRRLQLTLQATGLVSSWTAASSGPARLHSRSQANYWVEKTWTIDAAGVRSAPATARADNRSRLRRIESDFDGVPLLGEVVRGLIRRGHAQRSPQAEAEVRGKVRSKAIERFESETAAQVAAAHKAFSQYVLKPLDNLSLNLERSYLETTSERLVTRVRLSSDDQLAAHTPRPRAPGDSLLSVQVHQTALNNCLENLDLNGRTFTLDELHRTVLAKLNRAPESMPEPQHEDVEITFATQDAVRVRCADGKIEVTLAIAKLSTATRDWHNFAMRVYYRPGSTGLAGELVRDGSIYLSGDGLSTRSQIALRGVAAKLFPRNRSLPLAPERIARHPRLKDCVITQFEIQDGWIGVAVGPKRGPEEVVATADVAEESLR